MDQEWAGWADEWAAGNKHRSGCGVMFMPSHPLQNNREASMETTRRREEETTMLCSILAMPVKHWFFILVLIVFFLALYVVVYAGETGAPRCDLQSGLPAALNLSQKQCNDLRRLTDTFYNDTAVTRNKIVENRLELRSSSKTSETDLVTLNKKERELRALEQEFLKKAHETEVGQRRLLTPEQTNKMKNIAAGYELPRFGRKR
jgi:hypothetical protein